MQSTLRLHPESPLVAILLAQGEILGLRLPAPKRNAPLKS